MSEQDQGNTPTKKPQGRPVGVKEISRKSHIKFTSEKKRAFLRHLAKHGNIRSAAGSVGISRLTIYHHIRNDPNFKDRVEKARDQALGVLQDEFYERIFNGNEKIEYDDEGNVIKRTVQKDNKLLEKALESQDPESFGKNSQGNQGGVNVNISGGSGLEKLAEFLNVEMPQEKQTKGNVIENDEDDDEFNEN